MRTMMLGTLVAILLVAGCRSRTVVVRDPVGGPPKVIKVRTGPPPPPKVVVVKPKRPGPRHAWVPGHYVYRGGSYKWVKGHWKVPPRRGVVWVPGHFTVGRGWVPGHWR